LYMWGAQVSTSLDVSSPVPTAGAAVTRAASSVTFPGITPPNEARIYFVDGSTVDIDDWDGTRTPIVTELISRVRVWVTGRRP